MRHYYYFCTLFSLLIGLLSCGNNTTTPNVEPYSGDVTIVRYDQALRQVDSMDIEASKIKLQQKYPAMSGLYFDRIAPKEPQALTDFLTNPSTQYFLDTLTTILPSLKQEERKLKDAYGYWQHYFPLKAVPSVYGLFTNFGYQAFIFEDGDKDGIGLSLEMFLGKDFPYKNIDPKNPLFSEYITEKYQRKYIPKKVIELMIDDIIGDVPGKRLIDHAVHQGKKIAILEKIFPKDDLAYLLEMEEGQAQWCQRNELEIWDYFLNQELLFEANQQQIRSYVYDAPRSKGMPKESPGRTAHYIGYQIVKSYLEKTNATIQDLVKNSVSVDDILQKSKYKPKRK